MIAFLIAPTQDDRALNLKNSNEIGYAMFYSRSRDAVIRVYGATGNVIATLEHKGDFKEW